MKTLKGTETNKYIQIKITPLNEDNEENSMVQFINVTNSIQYNQIQ